jgi:hypothetical protein
MANDRAPRAAAAGPLPWIVTIYAILALTAFAFPAGLRDWLEERNANGRLWLPLAIARQIEAASNAIGVAPIGADLRRRFGKLIGDQDS